MYYNILMLVSGAFLITGITLCVISAVISQQAQQYIWIDAVCIGVETRDIEMGINIDSMIFKNVKRPIYRYTFNGIEYTASPLVGSNKKDYNPQESPCRIQINPMRPGKVRSSESNQASNILLGLGITFLVFPVIAICVLHFVIPLLH